MAPPPCWREISPGKTATISQRIALVMQDQDYVTAGVWVGVVLLISLFLHDGVTAFKQKPKIESF